MQTNRDVMSHHWSLFTKVMNLDLVFCKKLEKVIVDIIDVSRVLLKFPDHLIGRVHSPFEQVQDAASGTCPDAVSGSPSSLKDPTT
jgi:hypothetical protein